MNRIQFFLVTALAVAFAALAGWGALTARTNVALLQSQSELQGNLEKARMQQRILEQIIQRTVTLGHADEEMRAFLGRYGLQVREQNQTPASAPTSEATPEPSPAKATR